MKKLTIGLAVLLTGVAANSFAYGTGSRYGVCVPNFCGGFNFGVTGYYWEPSTAHEDFALTYPALDSVDPTLTNFANGRFHDADQNYNWGWGVNIGYTFACTGNDVNLDWFHFDHDESDSVRVADTFLTTIIDDTTGLPFISGALLLPTLTDEWPATGIFTVTGLTFTGTGTNALPITVNPTFARATSKFKVDAVDLDFGQHITAGCNTHMRFYGGLRYAKLEHKFNAFYSGSVLQPDVTATATDGTVVLDVTATFTDFLRQKTEFDGVGPRFGIHTNYVFGCSGFGVVGDVSSALLIGRLDSNLHDRLLGTEFGLVTTGTATFPVGTIIPTETPTDVFFTFKHPKETRVVPNMDAKLGLDYTYDFCNCSHSKLTIEAGWMVSYYWNSVDRLSETEAEFPEFRTRHTIDTSFQGPYVTLQVQL